MFSSPPLLPLTPAEALAPKSLNTGNLVLSDSSNSLWMSFDYPTDSRFPGMVALDNSATRLTSWKSPNDPSMGDFVYLIENNGLPHLSIFKGGVRTYRTGPWNGRNFTGFHFVYDRAFEADVAISDGRLVSLSNPYNDSFYMRLTMNYTGFLQRYILNEKRDEWILAFTMPSDSCDNYGWCGANSVCKSYESPVCECLNGFVPKSETEGERERERECECGCGCGCDAFMHAELGTTLSGAIICLIP